MTEPKVTEEVSYRTVTSTKGSTTSNKRTIVSRTTNVNAVQVNRYDGDGKLKSKDTDQDSWEERDTHNYEWTGDEKPAAVDAVLREEEANRRVFNAGERQAIGESSRDDADGGDGGSGTVVVLTSCNVCDTPSIQWTGTVNESSASNPGGQEERSSATKLEGSKWVHSEESVSVSMGKKSGFSPRSFSGGGGGGGGGVDQSLVVVSSDANRVNGGASVVVVGGGEVVVLPGATAATTTEQPVVSPAAAEALSPEQRRQMRRNLNREMSAKTSAEK